MEDEKKIVGLRNCPNCNIEIQYTNFSRLKIAISKNSLCRKCKNTPKETTCEQCREVFIYKTFKPVSCKKCLKKRRLKEAGVRKCPTSGCKNIIKYSLKWDRLAAEEKNTLCWNCTMKENSRKRIGKTNYDLWLDKGLSIDVAKAKWSVSESKRLASRKGYFHSQETLNKILSKGFTFHYDVGGLRCQGGWEKMYVEQLLKDDKMLPINASKQLTPLGNYIPDFEYPDRFVEIKSKYTYKIFNKEILGLDKKISIQRDKVLWVGTNTKPIQLLVLDKNGNRLKEEWYTPNGIEVKINLLQK